MKPRRISVLALLAVALSGCGVARLWEPSREEVLDRILALRRPGRPRASRGSPRSERVRRRARLASGRLPRRLLRRHGGPHGVRPRRAEPGVRRLRRSSGPPRQGAGHRDRLPRYAGDRPRAAPHRERAVCPGADGRAPAAGRVRVGHRISVGPPHDLDPGHREPGRHGRRRRSRDRVSADGRCAGELWIERRRRLRGARGDADRRGRGL